MQVYGDASHTIHPRLELTELKGRLLRLKEDAGGFSRHATLAALFIDAAELAQGLADAEFEAKGCDALSPVQDAAMALVMGLARALHISWRSGYAGIEVDLELPIERFSSLNLPETVNCTRPEGYAFYALYPEAYLAAAASLHRRGPLKIIGIRSIGLGLAALIAAAAGADAPLSVRPIGHPFARKLSLDASIHARLFEPGSAARFAIADEGPGLSGSSFAAVIDLLTAHDVPETEIILFPSHAGPPGAWAGHERRTRWQRLNRRVSSFEDLFIAHPDGARNLERWFSDLVGAPLVPLVDLSAGRWRAQQDSRAGRWPPAHVQQEARKYLFRSASGAWLLKFSGLDRIARRKLAMARALAEAGFTPGVLESRHGFIIEPWLDKSRRLDLTETLKDELLPRLAAYLGFRVRHFAMASDSGAPPSRLADMLLQNGKAVVEPLAHAAFEYFCRRAQSPSFSLRRTATDNRLHAWEWLEREDGRIVKTDALDHASSHDLVGCQDVSWDIAGAAVEFDLTSAQRESLARQVELASGETVDRRLIDFSLPCYLAFQLGYYTLATKALDCMPDEQERLQHRARFYARCLRRCLEPCL